MSEIKEQSCRIDYSGMMEMFYAIYSLKREH